jgi:hypothetical protein
MRQLRAVAPVTIRTWSARRMNAGSVAPHFLSPYLMKDGCFERNYLVGKNVYWFTGSRVYGFTRWIL